MIKRKREISEFLYDISSYQVSLISEERGDVWEQIILDAIRYKKIKNDPFHKPEQLPPFIDSESPDIVYDCDDFIMGIECFEFDASKRTRKGSSEKIEEAKAGKEVLSEYYKKSASTKEIISISRSMNTNFSLEEYKNSLLCIFKEHAKKIEQYRQKLSESTTKKAYLTFYIKDETALGNYICFDQKIIALQPCFIKEFREELIKTKGLDYIISNINDNYIHKLFIHPVDNNLNISYKAFDSLSNSNYIPYQYRLTNDFL